MGITPIILAKRIEGKELLTRKGTDRKRAHRHQKSSYHQYQLLATPLGPKRNY